MSDHEQQIPDDADKAAPDQEMQPTVDHLTEESSDASTPVDTEKQAAHVSADEKNKTATSDTDKTTTAENNNKPWQNAAHVFNKAVNKKPVGLSIIVLVILAIIVVAFFKHRGESSATTEQHRSHSDVLSSNHQRLLRQQQLKDTPVLPAPSLQTMGVAQTDQTSVGHTATKDNKAIVARRNAPTQMYSGNKGASAGADTDNNNNTKTITDKSAFGQYANSQPSDVETVSAQPIAHPEYTIVQGEFIHANLETAINSDLPGMVRAVIAKPIYAYAGSVPLIPAGSRLVGQYTSTASNGAASDRVFIIWNRIITPNGLSIMINSPGADSLGRSGMSADAKDAHFFQIFGNATLISLIGAGVSNYGVSSADQTNSASAYRESVAESFRDTASDVLKDNTNISPTLHIHQGNQIVVFVAKDLDLYSALAGQA